MNLILFSAEKEKQDEEEKRELQDVEKEKNNLPYRGGGRRGAKPPTIKFMGVVGGTLVPLPYNKIDLFNLNKSTALCTYLTK